VPFSPRVARSFVVRSRWATLDHPPSFSGFADMVRTHAEIRCGAFRDNRSKIGKPVTAADDHVESSPRAELEKLCCMENGFALIRRAVRHCPCHPSRPKCFQRLGGALTIIWWTGIAGVPCPERRRSAVPVIKAPVSMWIRFGSTSGDSAGVWPCTTILPKSARLERKLLADP